KRLLRGHRDEAVQPAVVAFNARKKMLGELDTGNLAPGQGGGEFGDGLVMHVRYPGWLTGVRERRTSASGAGRPAFIRSPWAPGRARPPRTARWPGTSPADRTP